MEQQQKPKWTAEVKREPMRHGHWYEVYLGGGQYRFVQYQKEARG